MTFEGQNIADLKLTDLLHPFNFTKKIGFCLDGNFVQKILIISLTIPP